MSEIRDPAHPRRPPPAPPLPRRVRLYPGQWIGLPLLMLVPLIALTGFFGDTTARVAGESGDLRIEVEHPSRQRVGQTREIAIAVTNAAAAPLDSVLVEFDAAYLDRFGALAFTPEPRHAYRLVLHGLAPGERRDVRLELEATRPWSSRGDIHVASSAGASARIPVRTFVFP